MTEPTAPDTTLTASTAAPAAEPKQEEAKPKSTAKAKAKKAEPEVAMVKIKLHNNPEIPPGGLHVGINGKSYKLYGNREQTVPEFVLENLDNAIKTEAVLDESNRIVGYQDVPRFPYTVVRGK